MQALPKLLQENKSYANPESPAFGPFDVVTEGQVGTEGTFVLNPKFISNGWAIYVNEPINGGQQVHPQDHFPFSPLPNNPISLEGLALVALISNFSKTEHGKRQLERIVLKYLDTCGRVLEACADMKSFDWLSGINNNMLTLALTHRMGLVADGDFMRILKHYQSIFDKDYVSNLVGMGLTTVQTLVQGSRSSSYNNQGASQTGEKSQGLATLANVVGATAGMG